VRILDLTLSRSSKVFQWYLRDAQGNRLAVYKKVGTAIIQQDVVYLYGSSRLGELVVQRAVPKIWDNRYARLKGNRHYELTNHLGNVLSVVTDRRLAKEPTASNAPTYYLPDVYMVENYYAFGQPLPKWNSKTTDAPFYDPTKYRYGFNGKEDDDEWSKQDYGFRIYDGRIGRFLSVDPLTKKYPWYTTYQFAGNAPILSVDIDGLEPAKNPNLPGLSETVGMGETATIAGAAQANNLVQNVNVAIKPTAKPEPTLKGNTQVNTNWSYLTDTNKKSADKFNMYVSNNKTHEVDESNANEFENYEAFVVSTLMTNFISGNGEENYNFPENGIISNKFLDSDILHDALGDYLKGKRVESKQYSFGGTELANDTYRNGTVFSITGFTGSASITITPTSDGIRVAIFNITSLTSGSFGKEVFSENCYPNSYVREQNTTTTFGNISQTFNLFIPNENINSVHNSFNSLIRK
jgi:RHS repeat-associated protein